jgi:putative membrane-bound dehydrogenase-like protein
VFFGILLSALATLSAVGRQQPAPESHKALKTSPGLELTLFASEPDVTNPTNLTVDERGRVWVLEAVNYRRQLRNVPDIRAEGDRIVILEDTDGDGKADTTKVFDQSPQLRTPLGIAVLGDKVFVSQSPDIVVYTKDADDRIVKKEIFLTGFLGVDHDHGVHALVFGPDGRYYFNAGNAGYDVTDKSGTRIRSATSTTPPNFGPGFYFEGAAFVINPDGTGLRVLAHNFRNNFELALDAFGNIWQTDNDDDGNAQTRANYVMEGGNYGYRGPLGRTWREDGGSHWHTELPGVVPNLLPLGPGSPCGLVVYEGRLLPAQYHGNLLHAEAGRRVLAHYPIDVDGAGFSSRIDDIVYGGDDTWFRPSDAAVAPDGSIYIADWYDPAVGGHNMGDPNGSQGRIYRLAPPGHRPQSPSYDLNTPQGLIAAFGSPAQSVFYLAHTKIAGQGRAALPLLQAMWKHTDPLVRARALWILGGLAPEGSRASQEALRDGDPRFRVLGLRVMRRHGADMVAAVQPLLRDPSPQVRREVAVILQDPTTMTPAYGVGEQKAVAPAVIDALVELARQYDGKDRWYLEAIGIAARGRENTLFERLRGASPQWTSQLGQLLWELRAPASLPYLVETVGNATLAMPARLQALDALAAMESAQAAQAVETVILAEGQAPALLERAFTHYRRQLFSQWAESRTSPRLPAVMKKAFGTPALQATSVSLAAALGDAEYVADLLALAKSPTATAGARAAALDAVAGARRRELLPELEALSTAGPVPVRVSAVRAIGLIAPPDVETRAKAILLGDAPNDVRAEAVRILARSAAGLTIVADLEQAGEFPSELRSLATSLVNGPAGRGGGPGRGGFGRGGRGGLAGAGRGAAQAAPDPDAAARAAAFAAARERAAKLFPQRIKTTIPTARQMEQQYRPDVAAGRHVFESEAARCGACHSLGGARKIGPDLSAIAAKYGRQAMLDAITMPSAGIAFGYESWMLDTKSEGTIAGILVEDTPERVTLQTDATTEVRLKPSDIVSRRQNKFSMMPEDLINGLTTQQVVDLLEFLMTLKGQPTSQQQ